MKFILISSKERKFVTPRIYETHEEAHKRMSDELFQTLDTPNDYEKDKDYGINENSAWANISDNYDWKIFCLTDDIANVFEKSESLYSCKSILKALYDGEVYPAENIGNDNTKYHEINNLLHEAKESFMKNLSDDKRKQFKDIDNLYLQFNGIYSYDSFEYGFRIATALMNEGLRDISSLMRNDHEDRS